MQAREDISKKCGKRIILSAVLSTIAGIGAAFIFKTKPLFSSSIEKLVGGAGMGAVAGLVPGLGFLANAENKTNKLTDKFIAENS